MSPVAQFVAWTMLGVFGCGVMLWTAVAVMPPPIYALVSMPPTWLALTGMAAVFVSMHALAATAERE